MAQLYHMLVNKPFLAQGRCKRLDQRLRAYVEHLLRHVEPFDEVGPPVFDPDSERIAFGARKGRQVFWKLLE